MSETKKNKSLSEPFNNIALCLSGGGFRAAAFSLGVMSYLDHLKVNAELQSKSLLSNVTFISSASGGTITNLVYSMFLRRGGSFKDCYSFLLEKMEGESLLNLVLEKLNDEEQWEPVGVGKRRNIINAFAMVYDDELFRGETFDIFSDQVDNGHTVCFNTTDFYRGLSFRFQTDGNKSSFEYTGNNYIHFDKKRQEYKKIKLADILAASSCFPGGFEPIIFPNDFVYPTSYKGISLVAEELKDAIILQEYNSDEGTLQQPLAFMDGGITDNQGLMSLMYADARNRKNTNGFDLIITGDVTSHFMDPFKPVAEEKPEGWRKQTIKNLLAMLADLGKKLDFFFIISVIALLISLATIITARFVFHIPAVLYVAFALAGIFLTTTLLLFFICRFKNRHPILKIFIEPANAGIKKVIENLNITKSFSEDIVEKLMKYLGDTKLNVLEQMVKARASSVLAMTMDVNLKHTRRLIYRLFFENSIWEDRRLYNVTFELSAFNRLNRNYRINKKLTWTATDADKALLLDITADMQAIADDARTMGTTLWFGEEDVRKKTMKKIVACGQFTTCMNMIEYVLSLERKVETKELLLSEAELQKLAGVKKQLMEDWKRFKSDPFFLY